MSEVQKNKRLVIIIAVAFAGIIVSGVFFGSAQTILAKTPDADKQKNQVPQSKLGSTNDVVVFDGKITNSATFSEALRSRGLDVKVIEEIPDSFFSVPLKVISVSGIEIQVYEFTSEYDIARARATISSDGTEIGLNAVRWMDEPHFFSHEKIIVQYIGHNPEIIGVLESLLGSQFAGSP